MKIDRNKVLDEIRRLEAALRALKKEIRSTPLPWETNLWEMLFCEKAEASLLYSIIAHSRGRVHLGRIDQRHYHLGLPQMEALSLEDQGRWIGDRWRAYEDQ